MKALHRLAAIVALAATIFALPAEPAGAAPDAPAAQKKVVDFPTSLAALGTPPTAPEVATALNHLPANDSFAARLLVAHLRAKGGHVAARALRSFAGSPDASVREHALRSIVQVGLRITDGTEKIRAACRDDDKTVRLGAYETIAAVGDATDVPALLEDLRSTDPDFVRGAFDALRGISGTRLPYREAVWRQWWKDSKATLPKRLPLALEVLEKGEDRAEIEDARALITRCGWFDLKAVQARIQVWLMAKRPELRLEAFRLCKALRLGDLAEDVSWAARSEQEASVQEAATECAKSLGVPVTPPPAVVELR